MDVKPDGLTIALLAGAPFDPVAGKEGRVYVHRLETEVQTLAA